MKEAEYSDHPDELRVILYNPEAASLTNALGISKDREKELVDKSIEFWKAGRRVADAFREMSKLVDNANELALLFFHMGILMERNERKHDSAKEPSYTATNA